MKKQLTHLLLAFLLLCAQAFAFAHSAEHLAADQDGQPAHHCSLCLSAHDLGHIAGGSAIAIPLPPATTLLIAQAPTVACPALSAPQPRQQSPPSLQRFS